MVLKMYGDKLALSKLDIYMYVMEIKKALD